jgi:hypothetical protein
VAVAVIAAIHVRAPKAASGAIAGTTPPEVRQKVGLRAIGRTAVPAIGMRAVIRAADTPDRRKARRIA